MKQLLFLLLFPCLALAQYQGNANQKITLGEQTTADGLVWRGIRADTTSKIIPFSDTSAYIILDTVEKTLWLYKAGQVPKWQQVGGSTLDTATMLLPYYRSGRALGTPTSGTVTNLTGTASININGTVGATTPTTGAFTTLAASSSVTLSGGTANGVTYLNGSKVLTSGSALTFNGTNLGVGTASPAAIFHVVEGSVNTAIRIQGRSSDGLGRLDFYLGDGTTFAGRLQLVDNTSDIRLRAQSNLQFYNGNTENMRLTSTGLGIKTSSPAAVLHLKAGTATASTAPLKFTSGTNLTTAEAGAMEFDGTNLFFSPSTTRHTVNHGLTGSATLDFPSTTTLLSADLTITVTGAADGDVVSLGVPNAAVNANTCYTAWVSSANTVTIRFNNYSSNTVNPASGTFKVFVTK